LYCAIAARIISRYAKKELNEDFAFKGGLLHDIGKAVLLEQISNNSDLILTTTTGESFPDYLDAEDRLFGINHEQTGHILAKHWKLPPFLQAIILNHHHPTDSPPQHRALVYAVHLGDALSMLAGIDTGSDGLKYHIDEDYQEFFDLSGDKLEIVQLETGMEFKRFKGSID
jgi:putative nucleotidyltransferase with HDIG domain